MNIYYLEAMFETMIEIHTEIKHEPGGNNGQILAEHKPSSQELVKTLFGSSATHIKLWASSFGP